EPDAVLAAVTAAGYGARLPAPAGDGDDRADDERAGAERALRRRVIVAAVLAVPVVLLSMVPPLQFPGWEWVALALATPVVTWAALPFHRAAWTNARHGAATMDTLVSIGVVAAYAWSVVPLLP